MKKIKLLVMDVDGTLTDGKIYMGKKEESIKAFHVKDGYGIVHILPSNFITPVIITGRRSKIVNERCKELKITHLYEGVKDKFYILQNLLQELHLDFSNVAYIGDDLNDCECLRASAISACPNDALMQIKNLVHFVCTKRGGEGAVREFIDFLTSSDADSLLNKIVSVDNTVQEKLYTNSFNQINKNIKKAEKHLNSIERICSEVMFASNDVFREMRIYHQRMFEEISCRSIPNFRSNYNIIPSYDAVKMLISNFSFSNVLNVYNDTPEYIQAFVDAKINITSLLKSPHLFKIKEQGYHTIAIGDIYSYPFSKSYDCIWCSHALEKELNINQFLNRIYELLNNNGILAVVVPMASHEIPIGEITIWNAALVLYNLMLAGFDCSKAVVNYFATEISIIIRKEKIPEADLLNLRKDGNNILILKKYLPAIINYQFDGKRIYYNSTGKMNSPQNIIQSIYHEEAPYKLERWIEITTQVGCPNNCTYCPQDKLVSSYYVTDKNRKPKMSLNDFRVALNHLPKWLDLCFTGMTEPFENKEAFSMLEYAVSKGYKVHVYTTLNALSLVQIEKLREIEIRTFVIHLPDDEGMMHLSIDEEYLSKLEAFMALKLNNVKYVCIGQPNSKLPARISSLVNAEKTVTLRAGNISRNSLKTTLKLHPACERHFDNNKPVICSRRLNYRAGDRRYTHVETTNLLPDGTVNLCCQDWGLQHCIGNLYKDDYETIMYGKKMRQIEDSMICENNLPLLCRNCEFAYEFDVTKWREFLNSGKYI